MEPILLTEESQAIDAYVGTSEGAATDMAADTAPSKADRILWLKALAAAIGAHQG